MTQPTPAASPERIFDVLTSYQRSEALRTAIDLDVFTKIGEGADTIEALAAANGTASRGLRILCDYLVTSGFLEKSGKQYRLAADAALFLDRRSPAYMGSVSVFLQSAILKEAFSMLTTAVRQGGTALPEQGSVTEENPAWVEFARSMMPLMRMPAQFIAGLPESQTAAKVLDIAAGHGIFGISIAQQNPRAHVTAVDWTNVLGVARENAAAMGVADRYTLLPGDAFKTDWGTGYDVALLTNFLHHFDPPTNETLLRKVRNSLNPNGVAITLEFVPNDDRVTPPMPASFALIMLASTPSGDAYTLAEYRRMFSTAGFASTELIGIPNSPQSVLVSRA